MASLPIDIITDKIFTKLPAKTLIRFKCISKFFSSFISSLEFINLHLKQSLSSSSDSNRLLVLSKINPIGLYSIDIDSSDPTTTISKIPIQWNMSECFFGDVFIIGTCNGLFCTGTVVAQGNDIRFSRHFVINPCTGVFREFPHNGTPFGGHRRRRTAVSFGFGVDDVNDDYKVVSVTQFTDFFGPDYQQELCDREVKVFSLKENAWKLVDNVVQSTDSLQLNNGQSGVLLGSHLLHWVFWGDDRFWISCFDVQSEQWVNDVPLMELFAVVEEVNVGVLDGCLCVSARTNQCENIWMMKEYGVKESWFKLFDIPHSMGPCCFHINGPFGFRKGSDDEVLVRNNSRRGGALWCNVGSKAYGTTEEIRGVPRFKEAHFFKGSLVPIPGGQRIEASREIYEYELD